MKTLFLIFSVAFLFPFSIHAEHPAAGAEGFVTIFDGKDLSKLETEGNWVIDDEGALYLEPREGEEGWKRYHHYLWLKESYGDFIFDFEYKHAEGGNSGFYFRVADKADPVTSGFEVQIMDSTGKPDSEMGHHDLGGVIKTKGATKNMSKPAGEWNRMTVQMKGNQLMVTLNGEVIQDFDLKEAKEEKKKLVGEGLITIQDHGLPFWVRNLKVKRL